MNSCLMRLARDICAFTLICLSVSSAAAQTATPRIVSAANTFLSTLDEKQRQGVLFGFDDEQQRKRWSNLPVMMVPRAGVSLKEMNPAQRSAAMALVSSALSPRGFEKVQQIMDGDEVNKTTEGNPPPFGRGRKGPPPGNGGNGPMFGKDLYFISILGTPSEKNPWMLQFGGHHLALNITIAGERGILTPTLTGAQPGLFTRSMGKQCGHSVRRVTRRSRWSTPWTKASENSKPS